MCVAKDMCINTNVWRAPQNVHNNICSLLPNARQFHKFITIVIFFRKHPAGVIYIVPDKFLR